MLKLTDIWVHYGTVAAVKGISFEVEEGEIVTLIGANGAGKTTTLRSISGLHHPSRGTIEFLGQPIQTFAPEKITGLGIAMSPENRRVFPQMTVTENLEMGAYLRKDSAAVKRDLNEIYQDFPILLERRTQLAGTLSGGQQQMLAIARAMMSAPRLLLLDEPSLGLAPIMCQEIAKIIKRLHGRGMTIVLVEQNARLALRLAKHGYVMETGTIAFSGLAEDLRHDPQVQETYLGM